MDYADDNELFDDDFDDELPFISPLIRMGADLLPSLVFIFCVFVAVFDVVLIYRCFEECTEDIAKGVAEECEERWVYS